MQSKIFLTLFFLFFQFVLSQNKTFKYFYIQESKDTIFNNLKPIDNIKVFDLKNKKYAEQIQTGFFKIVTKDLKKIEIQIGNRKIPINLSKERNNKFFEIAIFTPEICTSASKIIFVKGDLFQVYEARNKNSNIIKIKFPQVIIKDEKAFTTGNAIFNKYIFD